MMMAALLMALSGAALAQDRGGADVCVSDEGELLVDIGASNCFSDATSQAVAINDSGAPGFDGEAVAVNHSLVFASFDSEAMAVNHSEATADFDSEAVAVNESGAFSAFDSEAVAVNHSGAFANADCSATA